MTTKYRPPAEEVLRDEEGLSTVKSVTKTVYYKPIPNDYNKADVLSKLNGEIHESSTSSRYDGVSA